MARCTHPLQCCWPFLSHLTLSLSLPPHSLALTPIPPAPHTTSQPHPSPPPRNSPHTPHPLTHPPQLECYADDPDVAFQALRVATLLTFPDADPVAADARALRPIDPDARAAAEASVAALAAMARSRTALGALVTLAAAPLSRHPRMTERDAQVVQLVLTFARNALALAGGCGGVEVPRSLRADLLGRLGEEGVLDLVAAVAQHSDAAPFKEDRTLLLELVALIVKVRGSCGGGASIDCCTT